MFNCNRSWKGVIPWKMSIDCLSSHLLQNSITKERNYLAQVGIPVI